MVTKPPQKQLYHGNLYKGASTANTKGTRYTKRKNKQSNSSPDAGAVCDMKALLSREHAAQELRINW
jgi:hypothetical protein